MRGRTVLVVEEEYLIAADIEYCLLAEGAARVIIAANVAEADGIALDQIDLAVVEARLGDARVVAFATRLRERGVAVVVTSADWPAQALFTGTIPLEKPFVSSAVVAACEAALNEARRPLDQV